MGIDESFDVFGPRHDSYPGEAAACATVVSESLAAITRLAQLPANLTDAELTAAVRSLALVTQQAEAAVVALTADAIDRGTVYRSTAASTAQWVQRLSTGEPVAQVLGDEVASASGPLVPLAIEDEPAGVEAIGDHWLRSGIEPSQASRIAKLADAAQSPLNKPLVDAVVSGRVNTTIAKTCLDNIDKIKAVLPTAGREEIYDWLLTLGPGSGAKSVRELTKRILAQYGDDVLDKAEDEHQKVESLTWCDDPNGMVRFTADLSPDHAELFKQAIQSLAGPSPKSECCDDPHHRHTPDANGNSQKTGEPESCSQ